VIVVFEVDIAASDGPFHGPAHGATIGEEVVALLRLIALLKVHILDDVDWRVEGWIPLASSRQGGGSPRGQH
jgi:hypothetical protein